MAAGHAVASSEGSWLARSPAATSPGLAPEHQRLFPLGSGRSSQAQYPALSRARFPPLLPLWLLGQFGILVLFLFPETGGKLEAG